MLPVRRTHPACFGAHLLPVLLMVGCVSPFQVLLEKDAMVRVHLAAAQEALVQDIERALPVDADDAREKCAIISATAQDQKRRAFVLLTDPDEIEGVAFDSGEAEMNYMELAGLCGAKRIETEFWREWKINVLRGAGEAVGDLAAGFISKVTPWWAKLAAAIALFAVLVTFLVWLRARFWKRAGLEGERVAQAFHDTNPDGFRLAIQAATRLQRVHQNKSGKTPKSS